MIELQPNECRVFGVLVEKAYTTPQQYPMTLNAIRTGANQKSNRHPVLDLSDDDVMDALDGLRQKGLVRQVMLSGSRVEKYKQNGKDALEVSTPELAVLTELLLRGPQTLGELRSRASRMSQFESLEGVQNVVDALMQRDPPLLRTAPPLAGSRATRYAQLFCPHLHPLDAAPMAAASDPMDGELRGRVEELERQMAEVQTELARLKETAH
jgi:hypothetical protein